MHKLTKIHYDIDKKGYSKDKTAKKAKSLGYDLKKIHRGLAHYEGEDKHIISVKGTNPTKLEDLKSDLMLGLGLQKYDKQFQKRRKNIKKALKELPDDGKDVVLQGHSLGGSVALDAVSKSKSIRKAVDKVHTYNAGYTDAFHNSTTKNLSKEDKKELDKKVVHHRTKHDIVSKAMEGKDVIGKIVTYNTKSRNIDPLHNHTLDRFKREVEL